MKRKMKWIALLLMMLMGLGILIYPTLSDYISRVNGSFAIQTMGEMIGAAEREKLCMQRSLAEAYNAGLSDLTSVAEAVPEDYDGILNFGSGIMGQIRIPKIDVQLPIYHGIGDEVLAKGVGHLPQTAFPIGGAGNHSVLSGHTGLPGAELFTDLAELEIGDLFYITVLEETLAYQVDQIRVVLPGEVQDLLPEEGKDLCTLVTCTPYGINSHRLLVRGIRTELTQEETAQTQQKPLPKKPPVPPVLIVAGTAAAVIVGAILFLIFRKAK